MYYRVVARGDSEQEDRFVCAWLTLRYRERVTTRTSLGEKEGQELHKVCVFSFFSVKLGEGSENLHFPQFSDRYWPTGGPGQAIEQVK